LVKTAFFAADPNWGRILAAVGRAEIENFDISKVCIRLGEVCIVENGERSNDYRESDGKAVMDKDEIIIRISLGRGKSKYRMLSCDLSYDYVRINAEYRT
jgi:glutamate N-acetyltransferase/amino-acid N-acetyltransferase